MSSDQGQQVIASFVEHVRTVHFALLATCLALLAASLPEPPEDLRIAKRDLERIQAAANSEALEKIVNRSFLLAARGTGQWVAKPAGTYGVRVTFKAINASFDVVATPAWNTTLTFEEQAVPAISTDSGLSISCGKTIIANSNTERFSVNISDRSSLADFASFWNCLPRIRAVSFGQVHYDKAVPVGLDKNMQAIFKSNLLAVAPLKADAKSAFDKTIPVPFPALYLSLVNEKLVIEYDPNKRLPVAPTEFGAMPLKYAIGFVGPPSESKDAGTVFTMPFTIPADTRAVAAKAQQLLSDEYFPGAAAGPFERRFPQLFSWAHARDGRTPTILLEDLKTDIDRASESFELFGVKIPLSLIAKLGLLVLIAIDVYFCLHLGRLTALIKGPSSVPSFPWIGAYLDPISKVATLTSAALFPSAIVGWLAVSTWGQVGAPTTIVLGSLYASVQGILVYAIIRFWQAIKRAQSVTANRRVKSPARSGRDRPLR